MICPLGALGGNMDFCRKEGSCLYVMLPEEIDHYRTPVLSEQIDKVLIQDDIEAVIFDFGQTSFMDSSGIGLLVGRYRKMQSLGGQVCVQNVNAHMEKILQLSGIEKFIKKV